MYILIDVIILRTNAAVFDVRIRKIVNSVEKKYSILTLGWNRERVEENNVSDYPHKLKLFKLKAPIGKPSILLYLPWFWIWIFLNLLYYRPLIVHACDLDTMPPAYLFRLFSNSKLIFDVFDRYAMAYIHTSIPLVYNITNSLEEFYAKRVDALINVGEMLANTFDSKPKINEIILNCPEYHQIPKSQVKKKLTLIYTGNIVKNRGLEIIMKAIKGIENIEFVYAGRIVDRDLFENVSSVSNTQYMGQLTPTEASKLESQSDVFLILYDPKVPIHRYAIPNKIFTAMMFGKPSITNLVRNILDRYDCGIAVNYDNVEEIKNAIILLRDNPDFRQRLGTNGRNAYESEFNWNEMESRLYEVYRRTLYQM